MVYFENGILKAVGPYFVQFPPHVLEHLNNETWPNVLETYARDISDIIEMSVVPTQKGDDIISCMTYNPPGPFETGYDVIRSVSKLALYLIFYVIS